VKGNDSERSRIGSAEGEKAASPIKNSAKKTWCILP
jgi:hypothetical protein